MRSCMRLAQSSQSSARNRGASSVMRHMSPVGVSMCSVKKVWGEGICVPDRSQRYDTTSIKSGAFRTRSAGTTYGRCSCPKTARRGGAHGVTLTAAIQGKLGSNATAHMHNDRTKRLSLELDHAACYRAVRQRDGRFDG